MNKKVKLNRKIFSKAALILGLLIILPQKAFAAPSVVTNSDSGDTKNVTITLDPTYESEDGAPSEINYQSYSSDGYKGTLTFTWKYVAKEYDLTFGNVPNYGTKENDHCSDISDDTYPEDGGWEHEAGKGFRDYSQVTKVSKYYPDAIIGGKDYGNCMIWTYGDSTGQSSYTVKDSKGRYGDTVDPNNYYTKIGRDDLASDKANWHLYNYGFNASLGQYWLTAGNGSKSFTQHSNITDVNGRSHNIVFTGTLNLTDWDRYNVMGFPHADDSQYNNPYNADPEYGSNYAAGATMSDIPIYSGKLVGYLYAPVYSGTVTKELTPTPTPIPTPAQPGDVTVHCMDKDTHEVISGSPTFTVTPSNNTIEISSSQIPTVPGYTLWAAPSFPYSRYNGVDMMSSGGHISRTYTQGVNDIYILYKSAGGDNPSPTPTPTPTPKPISGNGAEVKYIDEDAHYEVAWSDHVQSGATCNFTPHLGSDNNAMSGYRIETNDNGSYKSYLSPGIIYCVDDSGSRDFNSPKSSGDSSIISLSADETTSDKVIYIFCTKKAAPITPVTPVNETGTVIKRYFKDGAEDTSAEQTISDVSVGEHTYDVDKSYDGYKCSNPSVTVDVTANDTVYCDFQFSRQNHPPVVTLNLPETVTLGDDLNVVAYGSDPDGDKITYSWDTPDGMEGTLTGDSGTVYFDNPSDIGKKKTFTVTVTDPSGAKGTATATTTPVEPVPKVSINYSGTLKENRKICFSSVTAANKRFPIDDTKTTWQFLDGNGNALSVDSNPASGTIIKSMSGTIGVSGLDTIIKNAGTYTAKCTVTNTYGKCATDTKSITITPDLAPTADFSFQSQNVLRDPDNNNRSTFVMNDNSYSTDGDNIDKRVWFYAFDSDNDGDIDDETWYVYKDGAWSQFGSHADVEALINNPAAVDKINSGNLTTIKLSPENFYNNGQMQSHVGDYYFREIVREKFGQDTIQNLVTIKDYKLNIR